MKASFLDILVNGKRVATIGPLKSEHCSVSVSTLDDKLLLIASGMYKKGRVHHWLSWLEKAIPLSASVTVARSEQRRASVPSRQRKLRLGQKATPEDRFCDFCKQHASRSRRVVQTGDSPFICLSCAELCIEIAKHR
jgi:ClpX C4-type zinc finger